MSPRRETRPPRKSTTPAKAKVAPRLVVSSSEDRHEEFAQEYLRDLNGTAAYLRVYGPNIDAATAASNSWRLLRNAEIGEKIAALKLARTARLHLEQDRPLRQLLDIAESDVGNAFHPETGALLDIRQMDPRTRNAIASVKVRRIVNRDDDAIDETVIELKLWDKNAALRTLMQHMGMLAERHEVTGANGTPLFPASEEEKAAREKQLVLQALQRIASGEAA